ncbi:MAG: RcnB family protein, partial [Betaproteobacteria bacterium]|nr:RcnB family protein [Betaproteobacteria bacterium]
PPRRQAAPPPQYRAAPPPRVTYRKMAPLPRGSYATYQQRPGRSWRMGRSLPRTVVYQEIPSPQIYNLAPPPRNHRYVRVGNDILLLAIGTGLIVNALYDIGY